MATPYGAHSYSAGTGHLYKALAINLDMAAGGNHQ